MMGQRTWISDKFVFVFSQSWRTMHISLFFMWVWFLAKFDVCWGPFFCPTWHYFISNPHHINILFIFWVNLFKAQNKLISHGLGSHGPQDPYFKRQIHDPQFLFINWDHNPMTSSTSTYKSGSNNESKLMAHITSLTLMASGFFNKSLYLHKMTTKPKVCHLISGLWSKLISLFGETLGVVVWKAKRYVQ